MGPDTTPASEISLAAWADQIAQVIRAQAEPVILVGHSRGGAIISEAAEREPSRVKTLVYLTAFLLPSGDSSLTLLSKHPVPNLFDNISSSGDGRSVFRSDAVGRVFYNTTEPEWVERAIAMLTPEPGAGGGTPLQLTAERFGSVPRAYIECLRDEALPLALQRLMHQAMPCDPVFTLDTDHSPFYSDPAGLSERLMSLA